MPWSTPKPKATNAKTLKAQKLDRKADKARRNVDLVRAVELGRKADRAARRGGWF